MEEIEMVKEMYGDVSRMMIPTSIRIHASKYIFIIIIIIIIIIQINNQMQTIQIHPKIKKVKRKKGLHGNRTRDLSHPKRESYH